MNRYYQMAGVSYHHPDYEDTAVVIVMMDAQDAALLLGLVEDHVLGNVPMGSAEDKVATSFFEALGDAVGKL